MDNYEEIEEKNRKREERKKVKRGTPKDCYEKCMQDFGDEQMDYDFYMSDGDNND